MQFLAPSGSVCLSVHVHRLSRCKYYSYNTMVKVRSSETVAFSRYFYFVMYYAYVMSEPSRLRVYRPYDISKIVIVLLYNCSTYKK